jgi:hypothetical protein
MSSRSVPEGTGRKPDGRNAEGRSTTLSVLLHALGLLPLLVFIALIGPQTLAALPPVLVTSVCLVYGRIVAFVSGKRGAGEAGWMAECLPFAAFACLQGTSLDIGYCLVLLTAIALMACGLVSLEDLLFPRYRGFALALGFCTVLMGLALSLGGMMTSESPDRTRQLVIPVIAGMAGLLLALSARYMASRRRR